MEIVAWLVWALVAFAGILWSIVWFLIAGWISTLLQIALLIATIYFLKYGWQRAPAELWVRPVFLDVDSRARASHSGRCRGP
jgi:hypothetical protein